MRPRSFLALLACLPPALAPAQEFVQVPDDPADLESWTHAAGADPARRPDSAGRLIASYDFEERDTNPLPVPRGWARGQDDAQVPRDRPGFPIWNAAAIDYESPAFRGEGSLKLPVKGDSASLMLIPGVLSVFAEGDYLASVQVRTRGLVHARACLVARLLDANLAPIEGAESRSALVTAEDGWTRLEAPINGGRAAAAFLQLELLVLQPEQYDPIPPDARYRVAREDYDAAAWFDDVTVIAIPRIEITPDAPAALAIGPTPPALDMLVRDLAGEAISVEIVVRDADDAVVDRLARDLPGGRFVERWAPALPAYGWYRAEMTVRADGVPVGAASAALAWAPDTPADPTSPGFAQGAPRPGLIAASLPDALARELPRLTRIVGARAVNVALWDRDAPPISPDDLADRIAPMIDRLLLDQTRVTLTIPGVPAPTAAALNIDRDDVVSLFNQDPEASGALSAPLFDRYGQRIQRWGLGAPPSAAPFAHDELNAELDRAAALVARLVTAPILDVPWRTDQALHPAIASPGRAATVHVVPGTPPESSANLAADWRDAIRAAPGARRLADPPSLTVSLEALDERVYGVRASAADLARHTLTLWQAFSQDPEDASSPVTIALLDPWRINGDRRPRVEPSPALPVWRTLTSRLRGRRVALELPLGDGLHALLLEPAAGPADEADAAIAIWSDRPATLELNLGEGPHTRIDLFGVRTPVELAPRRDPADAPLVRLELSPEPFFIEGVDAPLVRLLSSIALAPAALPGDREEHVLTLTMTNPWRHVVQGAVYIVEPGGFSEPDLPVDRSWRIAPRKIPFTLGPLESLEQTVVVAHSLAEEAGAKPLVIDVRLTADRDRGVHRVHRSLEVGLPGVQLDLATRRSPPDEPSPFIALEASVTNTSQGPISFDLIVVAPGQPRLRRHVADLHPGESALRTFAFPAGDSTRGARVAVALERTDAKGRLNRTILVD